MFTVDFDKICPEKLVLALGCFDGFHKGHKTLLDEVTRLIGQSDNLSAVFTFNDGAFNGINKGKEQIFTLEERKFIVSKFGVDVLLVAPKDEQFLKLSPEKFLDVLTARFKIQAVVCGEDYTFGSNKSGNAEFLKDYLTKKGIVVSVMPCLKDNFGNKYSSSIIKSYIASGDIVKANETLIDDYFLIGNACVGRGVGKSLGFPTINVKVDENKLIVKDGVYKTTTDYNGVIYNSITNVGSAPTFNRIEKIIETHLIGKELYVFEGSPITIKFVDFLRDIKTFKSSEELINQLKTDVKCYD